MKDRIREVGGWVRMGWLAEREEILDKIRGGSESPIVVVTIFRASDLLAAL